MKKNILSIGVLILILLTQFSLLIAQETAVPEAIKTALLKKYPNASDVYWEMEYEEYIASFENADFDLIIVTFNDQGNWLQTDISLSLEKLPIPAQSAIQEEFKVENFYNINKIETPTKVFYTTSFETATQMVTLSFDEKGKVTEKDVEGF